MKSKCISNYEWIGQVYLPCYCLRKLLSERVHVHNGVLFVHYLGFAVEHGVDLHINLLMGCLYNHKLCGPLSFLICLDYTLQFLLINELLVTYLHVIFSEAVIHDDCMEQLVVMYDCIISRVNAFQAGHLCQLSHSTLEFGGPLIGGVNEKKLVTMLQMHAI